jgi:hypothetical protein
MFPTSLCRHFYPSRSLVTVAFPTKGEEITVCDNEAVAPTGAHGSFDSHRGVGPTDSISVRLLLTFWSDKVLLRLRFQQDSNPTLATRQVQTAPSPQPSPHGKFLGLAGIPASSTMATVRPQASRENPIFQEANRGNSSCCGVRVQRTSPQTPARAERPQSVPGAPVMSLKTFRRNLTGRARKCRFLREPMVQKRCGTSTLSTTCKFPPEFCRSRSDKTSKSAHLGVGTNNHNSRSMG